jgi:predicted MFS family arabinose efflux permease
LGGVLGDIAFGALCMWFAARDLTLTAMLLAVAGVGLLSQSMGQPLVTVGLAVLIGGSLFAAMAGIYSTAPVVFPPLTRSAGTGIAFSLGRFGGALSPWLGALALNKPELGMATALLAMAAPLLLAAGLLKVLASFIVRPRQTGLP